ncbi:helix-turn-helix domain-containing protein [Pseudogemmobacter bohemicus]|uniref:helix-turn-helix domain-containing protein n=1 Tax=Pseudogemmobacter bohemicus TaxID=2250708 RepID=UPI001E28CBD5|nr:helix-turn-helix transcriptional regulator [Pseudogemmobacter bohemicus]
MHDAEEIAHAILERVQVPYDLTSIDLESRVPPGEAHTGSSQFEHEDAYSLSLGLEDGLFTSDLPMSAYVSPTSACRRAIMSLGVPAGEVGIISEPGMNSGIFPESRLRAEVERGNIRSAGAALASLAEAEALVLFSPRFTRQDRLLFSRMARRPVILLRDALSAEAATLMASFKHGTVQRISESQLRMRLSDVRLTRREHQVLSLLARGMSSKEISTALAISPRTVDIYRAGILGKMRVRNTPQLLWLLREGQQDDGTSL